MASQPTQPLVGEQPSVPQGLVPPPVMPGSQVTSPETIPPSQVAPAVIVPASNVTSLATISASVTSTITIPASGVTTEATVPPSDLSSLATTPAPGVTSVATTAAGTGLPATVAAVPGVAGVGVPAPVHHVPLTAEEQAKIEENRIKADKEEQLASQKRNKRILLTIFILAMFMGISGIVKWSYFFAEFGEPPSIYSEDSFGHAVLAYLSLTVIAPFGFIILASRISNMFVGMVFMFTAILVISFAMSGASRAGYSREYDSLPELKLYYQKIFRDEGKIPDFYQRVQSKCKCCGFKEIDRLNDWPKSLESPNFPKGCCTDGSEETCKGLGRMYKEDRVPSGFLVILPKSPAIALHWKENSFRIINYPNTTAPSSKYDIAEFQTSYAPKSKVQEYIVEIAEGFFANIQKFGSSLNGLGPTGESFFRFTANDLDDPGRVREQEGLRTGVPPSELLLRLDELVDLAIYNNDNTSLISRGEYLAFELPVFSPDATIHANRQKGQVQDSSDFQTYYFTRGIVENIIIDQHNLIWNRRCETKLDSERFDGCNYYTPPNSRRFANLTTRFRNFFRRKKNVKERDGLFVGILKREMLWEASLCGGVLGFVLVIALIFWYYYSRLKTEEQANLIVPTDFALLDLTLPSYEELDESTKAKEKAILKKRLQEQKERILEEEKNLTKTVIASRKTLVHSKPASTKKSRAKLPSKALRSNKVFPAGHGKSKASAKSDPKKKHDHI